MRMSTTSLSSSPLCPTTLDGCRMKLYHWKMAIVVATERMCADSVLYNLNSDISYVFEQSLVFCSSASETRVQVAIQWISGVCVCVCGCLCLATKTGLIQSVNCAPPNEWCASLWTRNSGKCLARSPCPHYSHKVQQIVRTNALFMCHLSCVLNCFTHRSLMDICASLRTRHTN